MKVYLLTGGNLGNRTSNLCNAKLHVIEKISPIICSSSIYESEPWGFKSENLFLNQVIVAETIWTPHIVLEKIKQIESILGRVKVGNEYSERTIDIDILFYGQEIINTNDLVVPHKLIQERKFVLLPMNEIAPDFIHPVFNKTISQLLDVCNDKLNVHKFDQE